MAARRSHGQAARGGLFQIAVLMFCGSLQGAGEEVNGAGAPAGQPAEDLPKPQEDGGGSEADHKQEQAGGNPIRQPVRAAGKEQGYREHQQEDCREQDKPNDGWTRPFACRSLRFLRVFVHTRHPNQTAPSAQPRP